jgi:hypothetical protein
MSCEEVIYVGAIMDLEILMVTDCDPNVAMDISSSSTVEIVLQRPDGTSVTKTATLRAGGTDGVLYITTDAADLTMSGTYSIQAQVVMPDWAGSSLIGEFEVQEKLG